MSAEIRAALGRTDLTHLERILLATITSHDRTVFNPSVDVLAQTLYGHADRRTREETRQVLQRLEIKEVIRRIYRTRSNGADDYSHIAVQGEPDFDAEPTPVGHGDGATPSGDGRTPSNDGATPGPKSKRAKKTKPAARGEIQGNPLDLVATTAHETVLAKFDVEIKPIAWLRVLNRLGQFEVAEIARGLGWFLTARADNITSADNPGGYILRTLPLYLEENIERLRESLRDRPAALEA